MALVRYEIDLSDFDAERRSKTLDAINDIADFAVSEVQGKRFIYTLIWDDVDSLSRITGLSPDLYRLVPET